MAKEILVRCKGSATIDIDNLIPFQGNLKTLSEDAYRRIKKEIVETGFAFPFHVWIDGGRNKLIGGHQRLVGLKRMRGEGFVIPALPMVTVEAKNIKEAKRRVLQDVSQFGTITPRGLYDFMLDADISMDDLEDSFKMPDMNMFQFKGEFFPETPLNPMSPPTQDSTMTTAVNDAARAYDEANLPTDPEIDLSKFENFDHECPRCKFKFNTPEAKRDAVDV